MSDDFVIEQLAKEPELVDAGQFVPVESAIGKVLVSDRSLWAISLRGRPSHLLERESGNQILRRTLAAANRRWLLFQSACFRAYYDHSQPFHFRPVMRGCHSNGERLLCESAIPAGKKDERAANAKLAGQSSTLLGYHTEFPLALNGELFHLVSGAKRNGHYAQILYDIEGDVIVSEVTRKGLLFYSIVRGVRHLDVLLAYNHQHFVYAMLPQ